MPPNEASLAAVRELLKVCTVAVTGANGEHGSGFFIDRNLVLTCAHVAGADQGQEIAVHLVGGAQRTAVIRDYLPGNELDLALVEVSFEPEDAPQPAVALDRAVQNNVDYYAIGYPREDLLGTTGLQEVSYRINAAYEPDNVTPRFLIVQGGGALVQPGMSGGALLSPVTGAVVGLVQYSNEVGNSAGGGAIPIVRAAEHLAAVKDHLARPPSATRAWRDALGRDAWAQLGNEWEWLSELDIVISGTVEKWSIRLDPDEGGEYTLTGQGLPSQVARAFFHWAQRRRVRDPDDVMLLGRLLGGALLPEPLVERVTQAADSDRLFVRLRFDADSELFDVPWEFVRMKSSAGERQLAADRTARLSRVAPRVDDHPVDLTPGRIPLGVLGVVVQPELWQNQMPRIVGAHQEVSWPKEGMLMQKFGQATSSVATVRSQVLENPIPADLTSALRGFLERHGTKPDVLHYVGFGEMQEGQAKIALSDDDGDVEWRNLEDLFEWAREAGTRLLVVQFLTQRVDRDPDPVPPRAFLPALRGDIGAVVFTRFPVHPRQAFRFNLKLYEELGRGETMEDAVQAGREDAQTNQQLSDAAGFGWFSLLTGPGSGLRLLEQGSTGRRDATSASGSAQGNE